MAHHVPVCTDTTEPRIPKHDLTEEFLYARTWTSNDQHNQALSIWNIHYNYHRPHTTAGGQPPASRLHTGVTNLQASYN